MSDTDEVPEAEFRTHVPIRYPSLRPVVENDQIPWHLYDMKPRFEEFMDEIDNVLWRGASLKMLRLAWTEVIETEAEYYTMAIRGPTEGSPWKEENLKKAARAAEHMREILTLILWKNVDPTPQDFLDTKSRLVEMCEMAPDKKEPPQALRKCD